MGKTNTLEEIKSYKSDNIPEEEQEQIDLIEEDLKEENQEQINLIEEDLKEENQEQINLIEEDLKEENQEQINFKNENSSLKRIGNFIKEARIIQNQSVEELASDLKIGVHQLRAIEEGNENLLPEKVFITAMVRRISDKLKIDTEFIMKEFKTDRKEGKIKETVQKVSIKAKRNRSIKNKNLIVFILFIIISGILGLFASSLIFNFVSDIFEEKMPQKELLNKN